MWEIRFKQYMDREEILVENTNNLYGIVIRECTPPLISTIKGDAEYEKKSSDFDTLWPRQKIKKTTAGVDMKANPDLTFHEQMIIFLTTNQGLTESDDDYLSRFNSRLEKLIWLEAHTYCVAHKSLAKT